MEKITWRGRQERNLEGREMREKGKVGVKAEKGK
jgi:hypothetical protein